MTVFFLDNNQEVIKIVPDDGAISIIQTQELPESDGLLKDTLYVRLKNDQRLFDAQYMAVKSYGDDRNAFDLYRIVNEIVPDNATEFEGVQLAPYELEGAVVEDLRPQYRPLDRTMNQLLENTDWRLGYMDDNLPTVSTNFYYVSVKDALKQLQDLLNIEFLFKVEISGNEITDKWVEVYREVGNRTLKRFNYGTNALTVKRETSSNELYTALIGRGKGEEVSSAEDNPGGQAGYGRKINFEDVEWSIENGNPVDKPKGQKYIELPQATEEYGIKLIDGRKVPRVGIVEFPDTEEPEVLINQTWQELQYYARPRVLFSTTVAKIGDTGIGDTVTIHRHDLNMHYMTRVRKVVRNRKNDKQTQLEIGDVVHTPSTKRQGQINSALNNVASDLESVRGELTEARQSADGKNTNFYGNAEPDRKKVGDTWFRDHPSLTGESQILVWDGEAWELIMDTSDTTKNARAIEEQQKEIESAQARADEAVSEINTAVEKAGLTSLDETISSVQTISNTADTNAQTALSQSLDALGDASLAITNAQSAIDTADGALSTANSALSTANNAKSIADNASSTANTAFQNANSAIATAEDVRNVANNLSTQVSGFETSLDGFNQTINDYEGQVSGFRNDVQGYQSTVASYETEVDEYGQTVSAYTTEVSRLQNTVTGFESTVANYQTEVLGYAEDVTRYENQVSTLTNTVNGFENTVTQYTTEVDQYGNEVNRYATEVSTLSNTVDGFNSTVSEFRSELDGIEVGGRNLIKRSDFGNIVLNGVSGVDVLDEDYPNGLKATGGNNGGNNYIEFPNILDGNGWYTLSFLARGTQGGTRGLRVIIGDSSTITDGRISNSSNEYTYHTYSYKVENYDSETNNSIKIAELDYAYYRIDDIKLEKGNKATNWTPAPEDMATASQVSTLSNTVNGLENEVVATQRNLQSQQTQVATLQNSVNGFNSTVQRVEADYADLSGTVNTHTTQISNMDGRISAKAEQSTVDTLAGTVSSLGTDIGVVAGQINQRVWNTDIETAIDGIEVGGRNLILNSQESFKVEYSGTGEHNRQYNVGESISVPLINENEYTLSLRARGNIKIMVYRISTTGNSSIPFVEKSEMSETEYKDFSVTFKPHRDELTAIYLTTGYSTGISGWYEVEEYSLKLEKGNKATDWTPAPEDTLARFDHIETEWTQTFDAFSQTVSGIDGRVTQQRQDIDGLTTTVQSVRTDLTGTTTLLNQTVSTVDTHTQNIASLRTDVNGKATVAQFNTLTSTVNGTITRVGNAEGKITQIETNVSGLQTTVASKASQSQVTQLANGLSSVVTDLSNLEIGGRNLLTGTSDTPEGFDFPQNGKGYKVSDGYIEDLLNGGKYTASVIIDELTEAPTGLTVMLSIRNSDGSAYRQMNSSETFYVGDTGILSSTFDVEEIVDRVGKYATVHLRVNSAQGAAGVYRSLKLERGTIATDWTPAPEDMATMDYTTSQISQLSGNINLRVAKNDVINQINISNENILIQSENILLDGDVTVRGTAWMDGAVIKNASIDGAKIANATIGSAKIANLDVSKISGNLTNFVQSNWNSAIGGNVRATGNGIISTAPDNSQVVIAGGHLLARQPNGATIGSVGYVNDGTKSPNFTIETSWGTHFNIKQNFLDTWTGYTQEKDVLRVSTYDDGDSEVLWRTNRFQLLGGASLGFAWRHYINGASQRLNITGEESIGLRANESTIFAVSNNGNTNHASLFANLNMNGSNVTNQSDARLKTNILDHKESSLEKINKFNFVDFTWIKDDKSDFGVIAQQVQQVAPELILEGSDGYLNLNNSLMNMMTSHGLQELSQKHDTVAQTVDSHTDTIHRLQQELSQANRRIEELERKIS